jgi:hypothetical protein
MVNHFCVPKEGKKLIESLNFFSSNVTSEMKNQKCKKEINPNLKTGGIAIYRNFDVEKGYPLISIFCISFIGRNCKK